LLDEFGGRTDPIAGGAISQAILEKLLESPEVRVVATTHCPFLKTLSFEDPNFGCASVLLARLQVD
jgi:dsDNA-specific endonuclease/ATPase MutS2